MKSTARKFVHGATKTGRVTGKVFRRTSEVVGATVIVGILVANGVEYANKRS